MKVLIFEMMLISCLVFGQNGSVTGRVIDKQTKQPLPGATILIYGTNYGAATNSLGMFIIPNLPENVYTLKVTYIGYGGYIKSDLRVIRNKTVQLPDIELAVLPITGKEVTITSGFQSELADMPVSGYSYSRDEIIRAPGAAGDIFRAIEVLPGVNSSGGEFSAFSVRGSAPRDNIILIDNIPFSNISHFTESGGTEEIQGGRFSIFTMGLVEKASFQAGGFSARYGGKKASFLDLSLKEGNRISPTASGSYDLIGWEVNYDGPAYFAPNTGITASARAQDFKRILDMMGEVGHGHPTLADYFIKVTTDINPANKISVLGLYSTEEYVRGLYHIYKSKEFNDRALSNQTEEKSLVGLNWRLLTGRLGFLKTAVYFSRTLQNQQAGRAYPDEVNGIIPPENSVFFRNPIGVYYSDEKQTGIKTDFNYSLSTYISLSAGIGIQQVEKSSSVRMNGVDTLYVFNSAELQAPGQFYLLIDPAEINNKFNIKRTESDAYAELALKPGAGTQINAGLRYETDNISRQDCVSPRLSASWQLGPETSLNAAAGLYYQLPDLLSMSSDKRNNNLGYEKAAHFITGLTHYIGDDIKLCAEVYYKDMSNLLVKPNSNNALAANTGSGYSYGVDLSAIKRLVDNFYGQINYSFGVCRVKDKNNGDYYDYHFNQPHVFNILAGYQINDNWSFSARWKYATGLPRDEYIIHSNIFNNSAKLRYSKEIISRNTLRYNPFHSLNIRIDYRHQFDRYFAIVAFLDVLNAYDQHNQLSDRFIEITGKNDYESLSFLPTIGFKIEL